MKKLEKYFNQPATSQNDCPILNRLNGSLDKRKHFKPQGRFILCTSKKNITFCFSPKDGFRECAYESGCFNTSNKVKNHCLKSKHYTVQWKWPQISIVLYRYLKSIGFIFTKKKLNGNPASDSDGRGRRGRRGRFQRHNGSLRAADASQWHFLKTWLKIYSRSRAPVSPPRSARTKLKMQMRRSFPAVARSFLPPSVGELMDPPAGRKQARMTSGELQVAARTSEFLQFRKQTSGNTGAFLMSPTDLEDFYQAAQHRAAAAAAVRCCCSTT